MSFKKEDCVIPTVWCGKGAIPKTPPIGGGGVGTKYTRAGSSYECMKKGFGAGYYTERNKHLPQNSLEKIKYVGETYVEKFNDNGIHTLPELLKYAKSVTRGQLQQTLRSILTKKGGIVDERAYNSVLVYLFENGIENPPACTRL